MTHHSGGRALRPHQGGNFFEPAVATAISLFGFESSAALATVVGALVEVPVMLSLVWLLNRTRGWYERADAKRFVKDSSPA